MQNLVLQGVPVQLLSLPFMEAEIWGLGGAVHCVDGTHCCHHVQVMEGMNVYGGGCMPVKWAVFIYMW